MQKDKTVATFFSKISQIRDQLMAIGDKVEDYDLVQTVFDGLPSSYNLGDILGLSKWKRGSSKLQNFVALLFRLRK